MKLEEMFWRDLDKAMAKEIIKKLKTTNGRKGIKKTDLEEYLVDTLGTTHIYYTVDGVINKLREDGYVKRKRFTKKDFNSDLKEKGTKIGPLEIPRYYLTKKGKRGYKKICGS